MRTEEGLTTRERQKWHRLRWRLLRELLRGGMCLLGSAAIIFVGVPMMEIVMNSWGARVWMEMAGCYFAILWLVEKIYGWER